MFVPLQPMPPDESGVIARAGDERRRLRHDYLGTEHILLALVSDRGNEVAGVLHDLDIRRSGVVTTICEMVPEGSRASIGRVSVTPIARAVIDGASALAAVLEDPRVEPKHYLLSMLAEEDSVALEIVGRLEVDRGALLALACDRLIRPTGSSDSDPHSPRTENVSMADSRTYQRSSELIRLTIELFFARRRDDIDLVMNLSEQIAELERQHQHNGERRLQRENSRIEHDGELESQRAAETRLSTGETPQGGLPDGTGNEGNVSEDRPDAHA